MTTYAHEDLQRILAFHAKWLLGKSDGVRADLSDADLRNANLRYANLSNANLRYANLRDANLSDADLRYANLSYANLSYANLSDANLRDANLSDANLRYANLRDANLSNATLSNATLSYATLSDAILSDGVTFKTYLNEIVPALLTAGGRKLADVATAEVWACHTWSNCPMHAAFGAESLQQVPALYRSQASRFVQLFDANLIPLPVVEGN